MISIDGIVSSDQLVVWLVTTTYNGHPTTFWPGAPLIQRHIAHHLRNDPHPRPAAEQALRLFGWLLPGV